MRSYLANEAYPSLHLLRVWLVLGAFVVAGGIGCGKPASEAAAEGSSTADRETPSPEADTAPPTEEPSETDEQAAPAASIDDGGFPTGDDPELREPPEPLPAPKGAVRLSDNYEIWIDEKKGEVIIDGNISLRRGVLEMFACIRNSKEHESIISANAMAQIAHTALLALGAKSGTPVQWVPDYKPPTGTEIEIDVVWRDLDGKIQTAKAQDWVRDARTGEPMKLSWVFAGSFLAKDEQNGQEYYMADVEGDFICVSNFSTAMLDVPAESTQSQDSLLYEAYTERIPPLGAPVRMILRPKVDPKDKPVKAEDAKATDTAESTDDAKSQQEQET